MFPIRCLVEAVNEDQCPQCSNSGSTVISDSYAIVAGQTPLSQLVDTVLSALGFQQLGYGCKASLQLKNWKPLSFEQITDEPDIEIENILKDVSNNLTLRILTKQPGSIIQNSVNDLKDRLLRAILQKVPNILSDMQQPQWKELLSQLALGSNGHPNGVNSGNFTIPNSKRLDQWLEEWSKKTLQQNITDSLIINSALDVDCNNNQASKNNRSSSSFSCESPFSLTNVDQVPNNLTSSGFSNGNKGVNMSILSNSNAASGNNNNSLTRFSPMLEVPKLERWFRENANPTRQKLQQYVNILNVSNFRKHTSKITYQQICNWFINARATSRRRSINRSMPGSKASQISSVEANLNILKNDASASGTPWSNKVFNSQIRGMNVTFGDCAMGQSPTASSSDPGCTIAPPTVQNATDESLNIETPVLSKEGASGCKRVADSGEESFASEFKNDAVERRCRRSSQLMDSSDVNASLQMMVAEKIEKSASVGNNSSAEQTENDGASECSSSPAALGSVEAVINSVYAAGVGGGFKPLKSDGLSSIDQRFKSECSPNSSATGCVVLTHPSGTQFNISQQHSNNRSRLMFDPLSELPMLEKWFEGNPHPSWVQIDHITETLNTLPYRHTYPRVSSHNVKIWFKNRRAKCKRHLLASDAML